MAGKNVNMNMCSITTALPNICFMREERTNSNRTKFRKLSREVCREVCDIPENNKVIFVYEKRYGKTTLMGEISYQFSDLSIASPGTNFDSEYYNQITFLFIKEDFQLYGIGRNLMKVVIEEMRNRDRNRPIRVQSAGGSVGFFEKIGFSKIGNPMETICGISLFKIIQNMELSEDLQPD